MTTPHKMTLQQRLDQQHAKAAAHLAARAVGRRPVEAVADLVINLATRIAQLEAERDQLRSALQAWGTVLEVIADSDGPAARIAREALS